MTDAAARRRRARTATLGDAYRAADPVDAEVAATAARCSSTPTSPRRTRASPRR